MALQRPTVGRTVWLVGGLWLAFVVIALGSRPLLPVDETRYLAVAWEMWTRGDPWVPYLNGRPYADKPPLLFWLIELGWALFGVNDLTPRLIAPLFSAALFALSAVVARRLWPNAGEVALLAPVMLLGIPYLAVMGSLIYFDLILAVFVLLGYVGLLSAWRSGGFRPWGLVGLAIGLGILTKGPVAVMWIALPALLAPFWARTPRPDWRRWYGGLAAAVGIGAALGLGWAIPAALLGGEDYRAAILWGQTAGRMVDAFDHGKPVYWFLWVLPLLLLPWPLWPAFWRSLGHGWRRRDDSGLRFCLAVIVPLFVAFSLISGKRPHYMIPLMPFIVLAVLRLGQSDDGRPRDVWPAAALLGLAGLALLSAPIAGRFAAELPDWVATLNGIWGLGPLAVAIGLAMWRPARAQAVAGMAVGAVVLGAAIHLTAAPRLSASFDMRPIAGRIAEFQRQGRPVAYWGKYHGQFTYTGRLRQPLMATKEAAVIADWIAANPDGVVVARRDRPFGPEDDVPLAVLPYRNDAMAFWAAATLEDPARALAR